MKPSEVAELLGTVQAYTGRTVGAVDIAAWHEVLSDLDLQDCRQGVVRHYTTSTDWIMPAHIRAEVKRIRADRLERSPLCIPAADPDDVPAYLTALRADRHREAAGLVARDMNVIEGTFRSVPAVRA